MSHTNFSRHLGIWPTLPPSVHFQKQSGWVPFPLNDPKCRVYSLARHAIWNACRALGLTSSDTILVPAYHHGSEIEAIIKAGLRIRYYEIDENLEPDVVMLESLITSDVRALYIIHYLGFPQNATSWKKWCDERGLLLFEDAAQAFLATHDGKPVGSIGHMGVFCLYKTYGVPDGAAVVTNVSVAPPAIDAPSGSWRMFKKHVNWVSERYGAFGFAHLCVEPIVYWLKKQTESTDLEFELGDPSTPPTRISSHLLPRMYDEETAQQRRSNYQYLLQHIGNNVPRPFAFLPEGASPFAFPLEVENATVFLKQLRRYGVVGLLFWLYHHPSLPVKNFPISRAFRNRVLALPVHQELTPSELQQIVQAVKNVLR